MTRTAFALTGLLLILLAGLIAQPEDEAPRITQAQFKKLIAAKDVIIVDTRNPDAYERGHIPGALLLPLEGQLTWSDEKQKSVVEPLKHARKPVVTYCA
jgi:rhodanese-related sulfurtransferase